MLSALYDIPSHDPVAGGLAQLDETALLRLCNEQLGGHEQENGPWTFCRAVNAQYRPGRRIALALALLHDADVPEDRYWPQETLVHLHVPVREPVSRRGCVVRGPAGEMEAYMFPNDRKLRSLRSISSAAGATELWRRWFKDAGQRELSLRRQLLRYVPESKFVARMRERNSDQEVQQDGLAVRVCDVHRAKALIHRHRETRRLLKGRPRALDVPRVIGADEEQGIVGVEWIKGDGLLETLARGEADAVLKMLAEALDDFHAMSMTGLEQTGGPQLVASIDDATGELAIALPALADRWRGIAARCGELSSSLSPPSATIHRDFYFDQVRVRRHRCTIVDLERLTLGDPTIDVASFVVQMRIAGHRPELGVARETATRWSDLFHEHWHGVAAAPAEPGAWAFCSALAAVELARGVTRRLRGGWATLAQRCLEDAEQSLRETESNHPKPARSMG